MKENFNNKTRKDMKNEKDVIIITAKDARGISEHVLENNIEELRELRRASIMIEQSANNGRTSVTFWINATNAVPHVTKELEKLGYEVRVEKLPGYSSPLLSVYW